MDNQSTCGTGLAAHAELPASVGDLLAAMAVVLDVHQAALDITDENAKPEHHAYVTLVIELRSVSAQLVSTARRMEGYRDLPMGRHDEKKLMGTEAVNAFERFVRAERTLLSKLTDTIDQHEAMLAHMR